MAEHWMQDAVKHPGALTRKAHKAGESVSQYMSEPHSDPTTKRQVSLAKTFAKFRPKGKKKQ